MKDLLNNGYAFVKGANVRHVLELWMELAFEDEEKGRDTAVWAKMALARPGQDLKGYYELVFIREWAQAGLTEHKRFEKRALESPEEYVPMRKPQVYEAPAGSGDLVLSVGGPHPSEHQFNFCLINGGGGVESGTSAKVRVDWRHGVDGFTLLAGGAIHRILSLADDWGIEPTV